MRTQEKKDYDKKYYLENKDKLKEKLKEYYQLNKEVIKSRSKKYYDENKSRLREVWNAKGRRQYLLYRKERLEWHKEHHKNKRIEFLTLVGDCKCNQCGFDDWRALQIDHLNGDGYIERGGRGRTISRKKQAELIKEKPQNYQVLCANCNWIKKYENKEHAKIRLPAQA